VLFHREFGGDTLGNADAIAILDDRALSEPEGRHPDEGLGKRNARDTSTRTRVEPAVGIAFARVCLGLLGAEWGRDLTSQGRRPLNWWADGRRG
jgi:hypothetical protein